MGMFPDESAGWGNDAHEIDYRSRWDRRWSPRKQRGNELTGADWGILLFFVMCFLGMFFGR